MLFITMQGSPFGAALHFPGKLKACKALSLLKKIPRWENGVFF